MTADDRAYSKERIDMETQVDRRTPPACATRIVQQGLLVQGCMGTVGAVEFLKVHGIGGAVIHRVLTSPQVRAGDRTPVGS
jgi:hypothetical protein